MSFYHCIKDVDVVKMWVIGSDVVVLFQVGVQHGRLLGYKGRSGHTLQYIPFGLVWFGFG